MQYSKNYMDSKWVIEHPEKYDIRDVERANIFIDAYNECLHTHVNQIATHSIDVTGKIICLGDKVTYDYDDSTSFFIVVFENNAFRKKYPVWEKNLEKPLLEYGVKAKQMRLKIISSNHLR
jgi:hypothetical protein